MTAWIRFSDQSWRDFPRPDGDPRVILPGPDEIRLMTLGSGPNAGYGVRTHQLSLGGQVGRQLASLTGRGVDVSILTSTEMRLADGARQLREHGPDAHVLVTTFGSLEAYRLQPSSAWRRSLESFFEDVHRYDPEVHVFFCGIVPTGSLVTPPQFARALIAERIDLLNRISKQICSAKSYATFVAFPKAVLTSHHDRRIEQYRQGAVPLVAAIADWLSGT